MRICITLDVMHYLSNFNILLGNNIVHMCDYINKHVAEICYIVYIALVSIVHVCGYVLYPTKIYSWAFCGDITIKQLIFAYIIAKCKLY